MKIIFNIIDHKLVRTSEKMERSIDWNVQILPNSQWLNKIMINTTSKETKCQMESKWQIKNCHIKNSKNQYEYQQKTFTFWY